MTDVVITGLGAVSAAGSGLDAFWRAMSEADRPAETMTGATEGTRAPVLPVQRIPDGAVPSTPDEAIGLPLGATTLAARWVARMAAEEAKLEPGGPGRLAVLMSSGVSDAGMVEQWRAGLVTPPSRWVPSFSSAAVIADEFGATVTASSPSNACAGGLYALAIAADLIRCGEADVAIAGAAETYSRVTGASFNRLGALDPDGVRPFHRLRKGTGLAEGAAALVVESAEHAEARGATVLARLVGSGWSCDAYHATAPDPSGEQITFAIREALRDGGRSPDEVALVVPHATGTELSDATECRALHGVFGDRARELPIYSLKALLGHTGSASGALSAVAALLMLRNREVPGNIPVADQDPECDVWLPTSAVTPADGLAMVNAFGFGGHNISLLFEGVRS